MKKRLILLVMLLTTFIFLAVPSSRILATDGERLTQEELKLLEEADKVAKEKEKEILKKEPTDDTQTIYDRYKDNSFELMTKDFESLNPLKKAGASVTTVIKEVVWTSTVTIGKMNAELLKMTFQMDLVAPFRKTIKEWTASLASSMLTIAGSLGITFIACLMVFKYATERRMKSVLRIVGTTFLLFLSLVILKDDRSDVNILETVMDIDRHVETAIIGANPTFEGGVNMDSSTEASPQDQISKVAEKVAAEVFRGNVYEPYLIMQYGTSDVKEIRKKTIKYEDVEHDRIGLLLDNEVASEATGKLYDKVTDYETEYFSNSTILYSRSLTNSFTSLLFTVVNLVQSVIYLILALVRQVLGFLQQFIFPLIPIVLTVGLFSPSMTPFTNVGKGIGGVMILKSMTSFLVIIVTNYTTMGYKQIAEYPNVFHKILVLALYILVPIGAYYFKSLILAIFTGRFRELNAIMNGYNPFAMNRHLKSQAKERKRQNKERKDAEKERKRLELEKREKDGTADENKTNQPQNSDHRVSDKRNVDGEGNDPNSDETSSNGSNQPLSRSERRRAQSEANENRTLTPQEEKQASNARSAIRRATTMPQAETTGNEPVKPESLGTANQYRQIRRGAGQSAHRKAGRPQEEITQVEQFEKQATRSTSSRSAIQQGGQARQALTRTQLSNRNGGATRNTMQSQGNSQVPGIKSVSIPQQAKIAKRELLTHTQSTAGKADNMVHAQRLMRGRVPHTPTVRVANNKLPQHVQEAGQHYKDYQDSKVPNIRRYRSPEVEKIKAERPPLTIRRELKNNGD